MESQVSTYVSWREMVWFPAKGRQRRTARTRKFHMVGYPAVDLTFDGKLCPHCMLDYVDF